jgi:hypothetical protein
MSHIPLRSLFKRGSWSRSLPIAFCLFPLICLADVTMEVSIQGIDQKLMVAKNAKRHNVPNSLIGGELAVITSLPDGMERKVNEQLGAFEENRIRPTTEVEWETTPNPSPVKDLFQNKTMFGFAAKGYQIILANGKTAVLWVTVPTDPMIPMANEIYDYQVAYFKKAYDGDKEIPVNANDTLVMILSFFSEELGNQVNHIKNLPKGIPVGLEIPASGISPMRMLFELKSISSTAIDRSTFSAHQGLNRVGNIMEMQIKDMQGN